MTTCKTTAGGRNPAKVYTRTIDVAARSDDPSTEMPLIETIRDAEDPAKLLYLVWNGKTTRIVPHLEKNGKIYAPPEMGCAASEDLRLPDGIAHCGEPREILAELSSAISDFIDLSAEELFLVGVYALSSWFPDCLKTVPYLWLVGPLGSGKSTLLQLLQCVCRRALLIGDVRSASVYNFSSVLFPTLLLDEFEADNSRMGTELRRLLRIGNTRGVFAARQGKLFSTFGSKALSSRQVSPDAALSSRAIVIGLLPTQENLLPLDEVAKELIAGEFQRKLLMFRLRNHSSVKKFRLPFENLKDLTPRIRDLAQGLAAPLLGDAELQSRLVAILREYDREAAIERSLEPEWLVAEALFKMCHYDCETSDRDSGSILLVGKLAEYVNDFLAFRGETMRLSARSAGAVLKSLGIRTRRLGNLGRGLTFTSSLRKRIHEIALRLGLNRRDIASVAALDSGYGGAPCGLCEEAGLTAGLRYVLLNDRPPKPILTRLRRGPLFASTSPNEPNKESNLAEKQNPRFNDCHVEGSRN